MESLRRVDDHRMQLNNDNDMLLIMLNNAQLSHGNKCNQIQSDLWQWGS
jgi:hypothetical protein